jgi:hypothetical protein
MNQIIIEQIAASGLSIYDSLHHRPKLFIRTDLLEAILDHKLQGLDLDYPIRTRSKILKSAVCEALGYPVPASFAKTQPRFPGQNFDTYVQKSNNLQIWNEEISLTRRYVLIRVDSKSIVRKVKVLTGENLAAYDTTGTLTQKYQAKSRHPITSSRSLSAQDTSNVRRCLAPSMTRGVSRILPIDILFAKLVKIVGLTIDNPGIDQERNRGGVLHKTVCQILGCRVSDCGRFPDVLEQLLELKLQTASTIDLGLISPDSTEPIEQMPEFAHCDVRYAVFYGTIVGSGVSIKYLLLVTGADFFNFFQRFEGKVTNTKVQLPLPTTLFD